LGAIVSMSAVLLVFQYGQPRSSSPWRRRLAAPWAAKISTNRRVPYITTIITERSWRCGHRSEMRTRPYNLTNIGTLFAFALVSRVCWSCAIPNRAALAVSGVAGMVVAPLSVLLCVYVMFGLPVKRGFASPFGWNRAGALRRVRIQTQQDPAARVGSGLA